MEFISTALLKLGKMLEHLKSPDGSQMQNNQGLDNQQANLIEIGWLAGMIDGEGSFILRKRQSEKQKQIQAMVCWTNTDKNIVDKFREILNKAGIRYYVMTKRRSGSHLGKKPRTDIQIYRYRELNKLLDLIKPYLASKKEKVEIIHQFVKSRIKQLKLNEMTGKYNGIKMTNRERFYTSEQIELYEKFQSLRKPQRA